MTQLRNLRWWIATFLACATALSYLDRQSFPMAVTEIQKSIPVSDSQYSQLQMLFLLAYAVMYAGGGKAADWLGTRVGYSVMIVWWSVATILNGLVSTVFGLGVARFFLGFGEGGGFPCSAKAIAEWFPPEERSLAFGIFNTGSSVGAVVAPPLIALIAVTLDWRWIFFITGAFGLAWAAIWWLLYDLPGRHRLITSAERNYIEQSHATFFAKKENYANPQISWISLFSFPQVWALILAKFLTDSAWFFFIFWLPKYLADVRHLNIKQIGYYAWIPYVFAGAGSFAGGFLSSYMIRRKVKVGLSRKVCLCLSAAIMPISLLITKAPLPLAIVFFSIALFGHQFWSTVLQTLPTDLFSSRVVGSVAGLMGAVGSAGAVLFNLIVGQILTRYHDYSPAFLIAGLVYPLALLLIFLLIPNVGPITSRRFGIDRV